MARFGARFSLYKTFYSPDEGTFTLDPLATPLIPSSVYVTSRGKK